MKPMHHNGQRGAVLVIALLFLTILTILGVTAMTATTFEEKMAGNTRDVGVAFLGVEVARPGLGENERLQQRLLTRHKVGAQGIFLTRTGRRRGMARNRRVVQRGENFVERLVEEIDERVGIGQRRVHLLDAQKGLPPGPDLGTARAQCADEGLLHG